MKENQESSWDIFHQNSKQKKDQGHPLLSEPTLANDKKIEQMITRMHTMNREIQEKLDFISQRSGLSKEKVLDFVNNQKNFSKAEWEKMQTKNKEFADQVWSAVGSVAKIVKNQAQVVKDLEKERKGKTIGARRNWIQMR